MRLHVSLLRLLFEPSAALARSHPAFCHALRNLSALTWAEALAEARQATAELALAVRGLRSGEYHTLPPERRVLAARLLAERAAEHPSLRASLERRAEWYEAHDWAWEPAMLLGRLQCWPPHRLLRWEPLGRDRHGRVYWLLDGSLWVQRRDASATDEAADPSLSGGRPGAGVPGVATVRYGGEDLQAVAAALSAAAGPAHAADCAVVPSLELFRTPVSQAQLPRELLGEGWGERRAGWVAELKAEGLAAAGFAARMLELEEALVCDALTRRWLAIRCDMCGGAEDEAQLLMCDACDRATHTYCARPELPAVPSGDWFCASCTLQRAVAERCGDVVAGSAPVLEELAWATHSSRELWRAKAALARTSAQLFLHLRELVDALERPRLRPLLEASLEWQRQEKAARRRALLDHQASRSELKQLAREQREVYKLVESLVKRTERQAEKDARQEAKQAARRASLAVVAAQKEESRQAKLALAAERRAEEQRKREEREEERRCAEVRRCVERLVKQLEREAEQGELYCICRKPYNPTWFYISCDTCGDWFHGKCVGINAKQGSRIVEYVCDACSRTTGRTTRWVSGAAGDPAAAAAPSRHSGREIKRPSLPAAGASLPRPAPKPSAPKYPRVRLKLHVPPGEIPAGGYPRVRLRLERPGESGGAAGGGSGEAAPSEGLAPPAVQPAPSEDEHPREQPPSAEAVAPAESSGLDEMEDLLMRAENAPPPSLPPSPPDSPSASAMPVATAPPFLELAAAAVAPMAWKPSVGGRAEVALPDEGLEGSWYSAEVWHRRGWWPVSVLRAVGEVGVWELELCGYEDGFFGSWYTARVLETREARGAGKLRVRYDAFREDDGSTWEDWVELEHVRPLPPRHKPQFVTELDASAPLELLFKEGAGGGRHAVVAPQYNVHHTVPASQLRPAWRWAAAERTWDVRLDSSDAPAAPAPKPTKAFKVRAAQPAPSRTRLCVGVFFIV
ncbi:hypothetical protein EMIHUDRAFT_448575 [Emiliania huxleyi CCMP1516]|uniref:PHD-type domain-containing protein n=2 Tax=Emiliania huxleyi TaxID=2903 RepID=A0A0D3I7W4_EMIH1|nr:hypothetical protein EMIHUDRAFT_448575 [Emiliania huxleyi CCMP1516]EOD07349.1 hypothetical protein EMIHUDRAFT_448575 [Emiliania huxleyi CCMP1516]|eukprot:XP_005759778.1 hypothetical protein EMIHUDRAFT_448575 [Emiliania huxleyi CCMP1516]